MAEEDNIQNLCMNIFQNIHYLNVSFKMCNIIMYTNCSTIKTQRERNVSFKCTRGTHKYIRMDNVYIV